MVSDSNKARGKEGPLEVKSWCRKDVVCAHPLVNACEEAVEVLWLLNWACELFYRRTPREVSNNAQEVIISKRLSSYRRGGDVRGAGSPAPRDTLAGVNHSWGFVSALFSSQPYNDTTSGCEARVFSSADRSLFSVSVQFTQMLMLSTCVCWLTIAGQQHEKTMAGTPHALTITLSVNLLHFISIVLTQCSELLGGNIFSANLFGENSPRVLCVTRSTHRTALRG